jgi:hypothetical protein
MVKAPHSEMPDVSTFADHEIIIPHHKLSQTVTVTDRDFTPDIEAIARAETALAELSGEFAGWMKAECDRLDAARVQVRSIGLSYRTREELFRAAHDIRGQGTTFGYPLAAAAADSLCHLLEYSMDKDSIPQMLIDQHVDGVRAIIREDAGDSSKIARMLAASLRKLTDDFLMQESRHRRDDLESMVAPTLVPKD